MKPSRFFWNLLALWLLCAGLNLSAQELTVLGGFVTKENLGKHSVAWQVDYRQNFYQNFAGSIAYINEGHLPDHHRDGNAAELWGRLPLFQDKLAVSLGVGVYYFYDTQTLANGDSANVHGTAPIYSLSATGYFNNRTFYRLNFNRINPAHEITVTTAVMGVGVWFGRDEKPTPGQLGDAPAEKAYVTENEITLFGGQSVVNTLFSQSARAYAAEYRRGLSRHLDGTASLIYEGDPKIVRRSGLAAQAWAVNTFSDERISLGFGAGPYVYIDRKHPPASNSRNPAAIAPLVSLTFAVRVSEHVFARVTWDRVLSNYNRDSDVFLVGLGYRWAQKTR
jgi:hypothetical protein